MTLKIGNADFDVKPISARPAFDDVADYLTARPLLHTKVFTWDCRTQKGSHPNGRLTIELDCSLSFLVLQTGSTTKLDKPKSVALRKAMQAHTALKRKNMYEAVRKAVEPVSIDLDATGPIDQWGKKYSFQINLLVSFRYFTLTPKNAAKLGSIVVGVPVFHIFQIWRTGTCLRKPTMDASIPEWVGPMHHAKQHLEWFEEDRKHGDEANERHEKREAARNAKKGIRIKPKKDG